MVVLVQQKPLEVAIVGAGITGLVLALGLINRRVHVRIYERANSFREIGAGIGFSPNAEWAMKVVGPKVHSAFRKVATSNASDWFQYVDGQHVSDDLRELFKIYLGERGFEGCARPDFLDELAKLIPEGVIEFEKNLVMVVDQLNEDRVVMRFSDGSTAAADIVIGCDGVRSRIRPYILGEDDPASFAHYSHKYAIRGLIPMQDAVAALGEYKPSTRFMHLGHDAHVLTFPVAFGAFLNVVAFVSDPKDWPHEKLTASASKAEVVESFTRFGPTVRKIIGLLPEKLDQWAVFDTFAHPAKTYARGRVAIAGDAAHAAAPHHGAGAGFGIEDAAVLSTLIAGAEKALRELPRSKTRFDVLRAALLSYDAVRRERCAWLVESSRFIGEAYEWRTEAGNDSEKCYKEAYERSHRIWDYDIEGMINKTNEEFLSRLK